MHRWTQCKTLPLSMTHWIDLPLAKAFNKLKLLFLSFFNDLLISLSKLTMPNIYLYFEDPFPILQFSGQNLKIFIVYPFVLFCFIIIIYGNLTIKKAVLIKQDNKWDFVAFSSCIAIIYVLYWFTVFISFDVIYFVAIFVTILKGSHNFVACNVSD